MISRFHEFISRNSLFAPGDRILLAVSGGIDSMVMWHLFEKCGYNYAVAHCNFQLRGEDSDGDEALVIRTADRLGIKLYSNRFETREYAAMMGISIEMAARELRYKWFNEIRENGKFEFVATAHHTDDLLETFFINLVRKTGIKGLTGFRPKSGHLIRPLFFTNREEIEEYSRSENVEYRTDKTNNEAVFQRNFIRHNIIPDLVRLNPAFRSNLAATISNLRDTEDFYMTEVFRQIKKITVADSPNPEIVISALLKLPHPKQVLFEWMNQFGFNPQVVEQVYMAIRGEAGRRFYSGSHRLVIGRNRLIITPADLAENRVFYIEKDDLEIFEPLHLSINWLEKKDVTIDPDPRVAFLDADRLEFPLILKKWEAGEYFQPFGMKGFKKISDFFTDMKLSIPEKEQSWILYSGNKVVWIAGYRIDNRFRISDETKNVVRIRLNLH